MKFIKNDNLLLALNVYNLNRILEKLNFWILNLIEIHKRLIENDEINFNIYNKILNFDFSDFPKSM